jgi:hypothetical protein
MYRTKQGDTWDEIALIVYGNEYYTDFLMQSNLDRIDTFIFSEGVELRTPSIPVGVFGDLPPWRR